MATTGFFRYHRLALDLGRGIHDLAVDELKFSLHTDTYAPNLATHGVFADATNEIATGGGYTAGGIIIPTTSFLQSGGLADLIVENVLFTASAAIPAWRYVVVRNADTGSENLIGYGDYGASVVIGNGETFAFNFNFLSRLLRINAIA